MYFKLHNSRVYINDTILMLGILHVLIVINCVINVRIGVLSYLLILFCFIAEFKYKDILSNPSFVIYLLCSLFSAVSYTYNGRPFAVYLSAIGFNVVPTLLYILGYNASKNRIFTVDYVNQLLLPPVILMGIGIVLYLIMPSFYYAHIGVSPDSYTYGLGEYRYGAFVGSLALGSICVSCLALVLSIFNELKTWKKLLYMLIIIFNVIFCMQRSAWGVACLLILYYFYKRIREGSSSIIKILIVAVIVIIAGAAIIIPNLSEEQIIYFGLRLQSFNMESFLGRSEQWLEGLGIFKSNIWGFGLGSVGQKAVPYNLEVVTDGNHIRILAELGVIGFLAFIVMNVTAFRGFYRSHNYCLSFLIVCYNISAIGSPIFDQWYASFYFWLILGIGGGLNQSCKSLTSKQDNYILKRINSAV